MDKQTGTVIGKTNSSDKKIQEEDKIQDNKQKKAAEPHICDSNKQDDDQQSEYMEQIETRSTDSGVSSASTVQVADLHGDLDEALKQYIDGTEKLLLPDPPQNPIDAQLESLRQRLHVNKLLLESARSRMKTISFEAEHQRLEKLRNPDYGDFLDESSNMQKYTGSKVLNPGIKEMKNIMADMKNVLEHLQSVNLTHDQLMLHLNNKQKSLELEEKK